MNARLRLLACASLGMLMLGGTLARASEAAGPPVALADLGASTDAALGRADLAAYRGWLKYLRLDAQTAERRGAADASDKARRLGDWLARIAANPGLLATLTGVQEWAYESPVDDSGQPFRIAIPTDYDPSRPAPLTVYMHGYSGNHIEHCGFQRFDYFLSIVRTVFASRRHYIEVGTKTKSIVAGSGWNRHMLAGNQGWDGLTTVH